MSGINVKDLRKIRIADMNLDELEVAIYRLHKAKNITMSMSEFCESIGKDETTVYNLIRSKHYPERLIVGGYKSKQGSKIRFLREEVEQWLRNL